MVWLPEPPLEAGYSESSIEHRNRDSLASVLLMSWAARIAGAFDVFKLHALHPLRIHDSGSTVEDRFWRRLVPETGEIGANGAPT
jgi:hypothetical protein